MNTAFALARANLIRLVADRSNLFFVILLPFLIMLVLSLALGGVSDGVVVGVADPIKNPASVELTDQIEMNEGLTLVEYSSERALRDDVARRVVDAGWSVSTDDGTTQIRWFGGDESALELRNTLESSARSVSVRDQAIALVADDLKISPEQAAARIDAAAPPPTEVIVSAVGDTGAPTTESVRAVMAAGELTLFIILTSLTGAAAIFLTRDLGITRRVRAAPAPVAAIIAGEGLGRFMLALIQSAIVFFGSWWLFGVDWGAPGAVWALATAMSLVGTGGALLLGTLARTEQQVIAIGVNVGLILGALGGSMLPLEFFPDTVRRVSFAITPHAWMNDALWRILVDGQGIGDVWGALAVLVGVGIALIAAATAVMARSLR